MDRRSSQTIRRLGVASTILNSVGKTVAGCNITKGPAGAYAAIDQPGRHGGFEWALLQVEGVFLVQLSTAGCDLHAMGVDAFRGIVIDPSARYPLRLTIDSLKACAVGEGTEIRDLRVVVAK